MSSEAPWLDWELDESCYTCTITAGDLPVGATFEIKRDHDFALHAAVRAHPLSAVAAEAVPHVISADGRTETGAGVQILNAFIRGRTGTKDGSFTFRLEPQEVAVKYSAGTPARVVEWLGNSGSNLSFPRDTDTSAAISISRKRSDEVWSSAFDLHESVHMATDHMVLRCTIGGKDITFLLGSAAAPSERAVRPGFIEYLDQRAGLPTEEERELIRAGLSFILDHQLVLLGDTCFDASHGLVSGRAIGAKYLGARYLLLNPAEVPAPIYDELRRHVLCEKRVSDLLQRFVQQNEHFRLDRVSQKIWDARTSTLDSQIARLVATIELLRDTYLGEGESLLPRKEWSKLCDAMKATLNATAKELGITDDRAITHLANKLPNINFVSSTKQFDSFFDALNLTISKVEQKAMDMRNHQAHGAVYEREHYRDLLPNVRRVQVLLNRVVLALIGHQGAYNNHTKFPSVETTLTEPSDV
jgi:hypothetical protein